MNSETGYVDAFLDQISEDYKSNEPKIEKTDVKIIFGLTFAVQCPMLQGATSELIRKYEPVIKEHQREIEVNYFYDPKGTRIWPEAKGRESTCPASTDACNLLQQIYMRYKEAPTKEEGVLGAINTTMKNCGHSYRSGNSCADQAKTTMDELDGLLGQLKLKYS